MTSASNGLLVIGGADRNDVSTGSVLRLDPASGKITAAGSLAQPLHDAAAASLGSQTLVFGGGSAATVDTAQSLTPGGGATVTGHLPAPASDLSALSVGGAAFVLGGYDGQRPLSSVLRTTDGRTFAGVGRLLDGVRYTATATLGGKIYAFGGELASGQDSSEIQEYDIATKRTVIAGHLPDPVAHAATVALHGTVYLLGGRRSGVASDQILRFDPSTNTAVPAGRLPHAVFDGAAATAGDRGFLVGGVGPTGTTLDSIIVVR
jgi:hypothetical protein